jgi:hypothetical protein
MVGVIFPWMTGRSRSSEELSWDFKVGGGQGVIAETPELVDRQATLQGCEQPALHAKPKTVIVLQRRQNRETMLGGRKKAGQR